MRKICLTMTAAALICGCASTSNDRKDTFTEEIQTSPQIEKIDADLQTLADESDALENEYRDIEKIVLANTKFDGENDESSDHLTIHINENSVIIIDEKPMSKNECAAYLGKVLPKLCTPAPKITIDNKADYDVAASVLEMIYEHGCTNVDF